MAKKRILERHKIVIKKLSANIGKKKASKEQAVRDAGYSKSYARSGHINKTKSWQYQLEKNLPDDYLAKKHRELVDKKEVVVRNNNETKEIEVVPTGEIDVQAVKAGLDMAYKLKSKYGDTTIRHKFGELSDAELEEELAREISEGLGN